MPAEPQPRSWDGITWAAARVLHCAHVFVKYGAADPEQLRADVDAYTALYNSRTDYA